MSCRPEFTEDEEKELAKQAKKSTPKEDSFEQETYDDVRVDEQSDVSVLKLMCDLILRFEIDFGRKRMKSGN